METGYNENPIGPNTLTKQSPAIFLGTGYTGKFLCQLCLQSGLPFVATSRDPDNNLMHVDPAQRIQFNLASQETWNNLPSNGPIIWCFPATPLELVQKFAQGSLSKERRLIVLGSTSAYEMGNHQKESSPPLIDESYPINRELPRVQGEEFLRTEYGANILRIAGIYGPGRNVLNWIKHGRVTPSPRYVNLVHVEDIAGICLAVMERGNPGEIYNVSDGTPRQWSEICEEAKKRWDITFQARDDERGPGKRISNKKISTELGYTLKHPNLYHSLQTIELTP